VCEFKTGPPPALTVNVNVRLVQGNRSRDRARSKVNTLVVQDTPRGTSTYQYKYTIHTEHGTGTDTGHILLCR